MEHNNTDKNKTYIPVHKNNNEVISGHTTFLGNKFNFVVDEENKKLPNIHWTPKLHKHLFKVTFIKIALQCSFKPLYKAVTSVLKFTYKQIKTYSSKIYYFSRD